MLKAGLQSFREHQPYQLGDSHWHGGGSGGFQWDAAQGELRREVAARSISRDGLSVAAGLFMISPSQAAAPAGSSPQSCRRPHAALTNEAEARTPPAQDRKVRPKRAGADKKKHKQHVQPGLWPAPRAARPARPIARAWVRCTARCGGRPRKPWVAAPLCSRVLAEGGRQHAQTAMTEAINNHFSWPRYRHSSSFLGSLSALRKSHAGIRDAEMGRTA